MRVAVLGATGRTGRLLIRELLRRGHQVRALVRDPGKLPEPAGTIDLVVGDSRDPAAVAELVDGADAVISALGGTPQVPRLHRATAVVLSEAMTGAGVKRFIGISGAGIDVPGDRKRPKDKLFSAIIQRVGGPWSPTSPPNIRFGRPRTCSGRWCAHRDWSMRRPPARWNTIRTGRRVRCASHAPIWLHSWLMCWRGHVRPAGAFRRHSRPPRIGYQLFTVIENTEHPTRLVCTEQAERSGWGPDIDGRGGYVPLFDE